MSKIRAISLWEPWASLIASGAKTVETRSWYTEVRGSLLICGAKKKDKEAMMLLESFEFQKGLQGKDIEKDELGWKGFTPYNLNFGKAVAVVDFAHCITTDLFRQETSDDEYRNQEPFGDYSPGRYAWVFHNIKRIKEPFEVKGKQGFFFVELPDEIEFC